MGARLHQNRTHASSTSSLRLDVVAGPCDDMYGLGDAFGAVSRSEVSIEGFDNLFRDVWTAMFSQEQIGGCQIASK